MQRSPFAPAKWSGALCRVTACALLALGATGAAQAAAAPAGLQSAGTAAAPSAGRVLAVAAGTSGRSAVRPAPAANRARPIPREPADPALRAEATATAVLNHLVDQVWEHSDHYFHAGDYETTARMNRLVVRMDPQFVEAVNTLAWLLRQGLNRPQEALAIHHRGIQDNPDRWEVYVDLGQLHFDRKEYALAAHYLRLAAERDAPSVKQHMLPHAYLKMGRRAEAIQAWREIIAKFPDDQVARKNLEGLEP